MQRDFLMGVVLGRHLTPNQNLE